MSISVIIPFYNETIFLQQAVGSVLSLGNRLHQIIIVDDSQRRYPDIIDQISALDRRIEVVTNPHNMGASASRNEGLKRVTGGQILFLDSDDIIASSAVGRASERMAQEKADLAHIPTLVMEQRTSTLFRFPRDDRLFAQPRTGLSSETFPDIRYALANWSILFDANYIASHAIRFDPSQRMFEDHLFILNAVEEAKNVILLGEWGHLWRKRGGSLTTTQYSLADMASQASSIHKCLGFLAERHDVESLTLQRDVAFCLARYVMTWPTLNWALAQPSGADAARVLSEIADTFRPYRLTPNACADPAMQRLFGPSLRLLNGSDWPTSRMHELFDAVVASDWDRLRRDLAIGEPRPATAIHNSAPALAQPTLKAALERFHTHASDPKSRDLRLFSEIVFDELDEWPASDGAKEGDAGEPVSTFAADVAQMMHRRAVASSFEPEAQTQPNPQETPALREAFDLTQRYLVASREVREAQGLSKPAIASAWRAAEDRTARSGDTGSVEALAQLAHRSTHGDTEINGRRKIKTRAKLLLRKVVPALRP